MIPSRIEIEEGTCPRISANHLGIMNDEIKNLPAVCQLTIYD